MMSCLWILVLGSLIAMQEGRVEASEDDGADDLPSTVKPEDITSPYDDADTTTSSEEVSEVTEEPDSVDATDPPATTDEGEQVTEPTDAPDDATEAAETESPTDEPETTTEDVSLEEHKPTEGPPFTPSVKADDEEVINAHDASETHAEPEQTGEEEDLARSAGAMAGPNGDKESQGSGSGTVAGVVGAFVVGIIGAISGYFAYQKKKLCFKAKARDPERAKEENGAQSDPQVLSNLLNSS